MKTSKPHCEACYSVPLKLWRARSQYYGESKSYCWTCLQRLATKAVYACGHWVWRIRAEFNSKAAQRRWRRNAKNEGTLCGSCINLKEGSEALIAAHEAGYPTFTDGTQKQQAFAARLRARLISGLSQQRAQRLFFVGYTPEEVEEWFARQMNPVWEQTSALWWIEHRKEYSFNSAEDLLEDFQTGGA